MGFATKITTPRLNYKPFVYEIHVFDKGQQDIKHKIKALNAHGFIVKKVNALFFQSGNVYKNFHTHVDELIQEIKEVLENQLTFYYPNKTVFNLVKEKVREQNSNLTLSSLYRTLPESTKTHTILIALKR